ncbi:MAG: helicase-related protein [Pirellulaceae bacterium]
MRTPRSQPRILLTNVKQLELLLTRQRDVDLFEGARLDFLVFDEAHTFAGTNGAETACLIRRLRKFCGKDALQTTGVATSATIVDESDPDAARNFASRFFGVPAGDVVTVHEEYQEDKWSPSYDPPAPSVEPRELLQKTLAAVDADDPESAIRELYQDLTGKTLAEGDWKSGLFDGLRENNVAAQIRVSLLRPRELYLLLSELKTTVGRDVSEEELLAYLTLGAASLKEGRPLLRPVVHGFIRGISGAVVTFPTDNEPKLWLSSEDELKRREDDDRIWRPRVHTCTTCGQHYFAGFLKDFQFSKGKPEGGQLADGGGHYWEALDKVNGGNRVVLVDRIISQDDDQDLEDADRAHPLYFCRYCGSASPNEFTRCFGCGSASDPVKLFVVRETSKHPGNLSSCLSCGARGKSMGRRFREPIREVRAVNVSDVHVLAQDMVHHAERQRLLVFADNRQDAAFQAGWMKDHSRRFRLRALMAEAMKDGHVSIGDMTLKISEELDRNDGLSRALIPEVWRAVPKEGTGGKHEDERLHFLRIQVLREVTTAANQQVGLEPWGRLKVRYDRLDPSAPFVQTWSNKLHLPPGEFTAGIAAVLDHLRRRRLLYDSRRAIFSRYWNEGDREVQRGYLPVLPGPQGMKLRAAADDDKSKVVQWIGQRQTLMRQIAKKWGIVDDDAVPFLEGLWAYLTDPAVGILIPVTLKSSRDRALPNCSGVFQIDSAKLRLSENHGYYRCKRCRRKVMRRTPRNKCHAWQCDGELDFVSEEPDNYNLQLLDEGYSMLRPEEHTAMVPQEHRERIENWFKGSGDAVNTMVCTQTLELGVDIGALDSVLLRNVPPLPANYWQRAGRAGRRHRMAVNITYCRPTSHDRAYFNEPTKMLGGKVDPPAFNLRNDVMVSKHVHAAVITRLNQLVRDGSLGDERREQIQSTLRAMFPRRVSAYLFQPTGQLRTVPFDVTPLTQLVAQHRDDLREFMIGIFHQGWPATDAEVTTEDALAAHLDNMADELGIVLKRLRRRLLWAFREVQRLNKKRDEEATLDHEDEAHFRRCDRLIKRLKGVQSRRGREAEGFDDINTYGVLAAEGFLPGYGLDTGAVVGMAEVPYWQLGSMDFDLPRASSIALREYVPGNLIYANGHRFVARRFHRDVEGDQGEMPLFEVNVDREAVSETNAGQHAGALGSIRLAAIPVCDVDLMHQSQISDEEEFRFQMSVATYGREQGRHNGGTMYGWGEKQLSLRLGVHLRLVNVGATALIQQDTPELGYPVCTVCGQSVSPLASDRQLEVFKEHHDERCGKMPQSIGFFADIVADCLTLPECANATEAYSILEAIRMAATRVLDMHIEDLQILVIGHVDRDERDGVLWDPMPGGSGLLQQIHANFQRIIEVAQEIVHGCPSACENSCIDCLQTFRNSYYHKYLDRHVALELLGAWGNSLEQRHDIPPTHPTTDSGDPDAQPVNDGETKLKHLLKTAGFTSGHFQNQIRFKQPIVLDHLIGSTTPDVHFAGDEDDEDDRGVCIYLDGMSDALHGNPETAARDQEIRSWLRNNGYQVIEITYVELDDCNAMVRHFKKLGRYLEGKDLAKQVATDVSWFNYDDLASTSPETKSKTYELGDLLTLAPSGTTIAVYLPPDSVLEECDSRGVAHFHFLAAADGQPPMQTTVIVRHPKLRRGDQSVPIAAGKISWTKQMDVESGERVMLVTLRSSGLPAKLKLTIDEWDAFQPLAVIGG